MAGSNGLEAAKSHTSRKDIEEKDKRAEDELEKDTWYCLQCRRRPYYEKARLDTILRDAERDAQIDWADIEAGASRLPSKMNLSKVSGITQELFPWISFEHTTPNADRASVPATHIPLSPRPTGNQKQAQVFTRNRDLDSQYSQDASDTVEITIASLHIEKKHSITRDKTEAEAGLTSVMAPHLESESASLALRSNKHPY